MEQPCKKQDPQFRGWDGTRRGVGSAEISLSSSKFSYLREGFANMHWKSCEIGAGELPWGTETLYL